MANNTPSSPKIALVADWLTNMGGAEHLFYSLHKAFPDAHIYTSVFDPQACPKFTGLNVHTTYLQKLPRALRYKHQLWPVLRARAFRKLDLSNYDIVISAASAEAKAVNARPGAVHICYCHTPTRYYWSHYREYKKEPGFGWLDPVIKLALPPFVHFMRRADLRAAKGVDHFIANSHEVQWRIKRYYKREAEVIYPPVETTRLRPLKAIRKEDFYLIVGRQIPYKRIDLAIRACNILRKKLVVIGKGSEHHRLTKIAGPTIQFLTDVDDEAIVSYFQRAKAFLHPQLEDFGIVPVEAMSAGTPVIAYGQGGALDSVIPGKTGVFFDPQSIEALVNAIKDFEKQHFSSATIIQHAQAFSEERFIREIRAVVHATAQSPKTHHTHSRSRKTRPTAYDNR